MWKAERVCRADVYPIGSNGIWLLLTPIGLECFDALCWFEVTVKCLLVIIRCANWKKTCSPWKKGSCMTVKWSLPSSERHAFSLVYLRERECDGHGEVNRSCCQSSSCKRWVQNEWVKIGKDRNLGKDALSLGNSFTFGLKLAFGFML